MVIAIGHSAFIPIMTLEQLYGVCVARFPLLRM
jgi:hypothetical protein